MYSFCILYSVWIHIECIFVAATYVAKLQRRQEITRRCDMFQHLLRKYLCGLQPINNRFAPCNVLYGFDGALSAVSLIQRLRCCKATPDGTAVFFELLEIFPRERWIV